MGDRNVTRPAALPATLDARLPPCGGESALDTLLCPPGDSAVSWRLISSVSLSMAASSSINARARASPASSMAARLEVLQLPDADTPP